MPPGSRAMELWTVRSQSVFLDSFGRPDPNQDPPCERTPRHDGGAGAAPDELAGPAAEGDARRRPAAELAASKRIAARNRRGAVSAGVRPAADDRRRRQRLHDAASRKRRRRRQAIEDLMWALINTPGVRVSGLKASSRTWPTLSKLRRDRRAATACKLGLAGTARRRLSSTLLRLRARAGDGRRRPKTSCILIWMDGGPTHYETFDPKPDAPAEIRGEFEPIATRTAGRLLLRAHEAAGRPSPTSSRSSARSATIRATTAPATTT